MASGKVQRGLLGRSSLVAGAVALAVAVSAPVVSAATPRTTRVSAGNGISGEPELSGNGRFVVFESVADDLVPSDTNNARDIFVYDRKTKTTTLVSRDSGGDEGNEDSTEPDISADGRFVVFESHANDLVPVDTNGTLDVFLHDRNTGQTRLVSVHSNGTQGNGPSSKASISADGRWIAFESQSTNLVNVDGNGAKDVFLHDRVTGKTSLISRRSNGTLGDAVSEDPSISGNGRFIAFDSVATNLVSGDDNGVKDIFVHDRGTGRTTLVSRRSDGKRGNGESDDAAISKNGRFVAFGSASSNLVPRDGNGDEDVFVHDRKTKKTTRISVRSNGRQGNADSQEPNVSANGRWVVFDSDAGNLVKGDTNGVADAFLHDRSTKKTTLLSRRARNGAIGNGDSDDVVISDDGRWAAFESDATNLVSGDGNGVQDIFRRGSLR